MDANLNGDFFDYAATNKAVNKIRNRASEFSSTSEKSGSAGPRTAFQRTRYNTAEEERVYKTYSTGTAAQQVQYNGPELRLVDDEESDGEQPSTSGSAKGLSVKIVSLRPRVVRKGGKKTDSHVKTVSHSGHARHRPTNDSDESMAKANVKAMQIMRLNERQGIPPTSSAPKDSHKQLNTSTEKFVGGGEI